MKKILSIIAATTAILAVSCTKEEKLEVQKLPDLNDEVFDEQYYENLRAYKKTDHILSYVFFAAWAPLEGSENLNIEYTTMRQRIIALPDSLDVVNLWMGAPSNDPADEYDYSPNAYADVQYCREKKGTRFVIHADASHYRHKFTYNGVDYDMTQDRGEEVIRAFANYQAERVKKYNLDGVDWDYEGWSASDMLIAIQETGKHFGPMAETEEGKKMLNIIDYYGRYPGSEVNPYLSYMVRQAYSVQDGGRTMSYISGPDWAVDEEGNSKMIFCEQWNQGTNKDTGGKPWYNEDGSPMMTYIDGQPTQMMSLEAYARRCMDGHGAGFGAYYIDSDWFFKRGPYWNLRRCIQIANPSIH